MKFIFNIIWTGYAYQCLIHTGRRLTEADKQQVMEELKWRLTQ